MCVELLIFLCHYWVLSKLYVDFGLWELTMPKPLTKDRNKLWKTLKQMGIPDHLTHLLRNLYAVQEATVRIGHGTTDWFQIRKGVHQGCILSPICRVHHEKRWAGRSTSWDQDCWEKYQ